MFVPHGYWHMVVNLDACVALTHNYVSTSNLSDCLHFLREKKEQISGLRDRLGHGAVPPEQLYDCFVEKLADKIGADKLTQYIEQSFKGLHIIFLSIYMYVFMYVCSTICTVTSSSFRLN